ncbi:unnamed protein product [Prunus brigantina]
MTWPKRHRFEPGHTKREKKERNSPNATLNPHPTPQKNPKSPNPQPKSSNPNPQSPPNHLPPGSCRREIDHYFSKFPIFNCRRRG